MVGSQAHERVIAEEDLALIRRIKPVMQLKKVVLPAPLGPITLEIESTG